MACKLPVLPVPDFDAVDGILFAPEQYVYDLPGPMSILCLFVRAPALAIRAFRLFAVARRCNWEDEARLALTPTLTHHLHDRLLCPVLERLSTNA
ncbi:unnamed protein product [Mycena citricolor]|uniref:Uncharacterized protein n=1 Tax=Mycena citricolor TaxID=2018698 RepID=A0AAD2K369_9AGAR|nr:unnamed protein product [Mycena citricolor]CAK5273334.1 unnamed protein product [Mycena citricolor]CAK5275126.1 unnamed protein product [Mycena citricolor]